MSFSNRSTNGPFFSRDFGDTLKVIYEHVYSYSVMLKADTQIKLLKIHVTDKNLYKPGENIDIGMGAKLYVSLST